MSVQIYAQNVEMSPTLAQFVERCMGFVLGRFSARVARFTLRLEDLNGPRGGLDQQCRIEMTLIPSGRITVQATGRNLETAIKRAADRIAHCIRRDLDRRQTRGTRIGCGCGR